MREQLAWVQQGDNEHVAGSARERPVVSATSAAQPGAGVVDREGGDEHHIGGLELNFGTGGNRDAAATGLQGTRIDRERERVVGAQDRQHNGDPAASQLGAKLRGIGFSRAGNVECDATRAEHVGVREQRRRPRAGLSNRVRRASPNLQQPGSKRGFVRERGE